MEERKSSALPRGSLLRGGTYSIVRLIDRGGFGCTYEASHVMLQKRVALKEFFPKEYCERDEASSFVNVGVTDNAGRVAAMRKKFVEEARTLAGLSHSGIVRVSDVFEENGTAYYVMDYIEGKSLSALVKERGSLPEEEAVGYIRQVCEALTLVHSLGRLHLDIKPANIMLDGEGKALLIDFGASKQYSEGSGENTSTFVARTPGYAPLEQNSGNGMKTFSPATDIYALGATLYKLLTGSTPPDAADIASGEELPPLPTAISAGTRAAVTAAMKTKRSDRPQSVAEFTALLGGGAGESGQDGYDDEETTMLGDSPAGSGITSSSKSEPSQKVTSTKKDGSRHKSWIIACLIAVAAVAVALVVLLSGPRQPDPPVEDPIAQSTGESATEPLKTASSSSSSGSSSSSSSVSSATGSINGHGYVDLGLSVKWATCNVGASSPEGYGNYYAWGETKTKLNYTEDNSVMYGKSMGNIGGNAQYDAATAKWGSSWRLPTQGECQELLDNCTWTWTTHNEVKGYKVTSEVNGRSIFLPAAGDRYGSSLYYAGSYGSYWGSPPYSSGTDGACRLYFDSGGHNVDWSTRGDGQSVRPVSE